MKKNIIVCNSDNEIIRNAALLLSQILLDATVEYPVVTDCEHYQENDGFQNLIDHAFGGISRYFAHKNLLIPRNALWTHSMM